MSVHEAMVFIPIKYFGEATNRLNRALPRLQHVPLVKKFDVLFEEVVECEHGTHLSGLRGGMVSMDELVALAQALCEVAVSTHEEDGPMYPYISFGITESQTLVIDITSQGLIADIV